MLYMPSYDNNLAWETVRVVGIIFVAMYFSFLVVASERHLTENNGQPMQPFIAEAFFVRREVNIASTVTTSKDRVIIANKSIQMIEGIINTQPTSDGVLGRLSMLVSGPILTLVRLRALHSGQYRSRYSR